MEELYVFNDIKYFPARKKININPNTYIIRAFLFI